MDTFSHLVFSLLFCLLLFCYAYIHRYPVYGSITLVNCTVPWVFPYKAIIIQGKCSTPSLVISFFLRSTTSNSCPVILNAFGNLTLYGAHTHTPRFSGKEEGSLYAQSISLSPKSRQQVFKFLLQVLYFPKRRWCLGAFWYIPCTQNCKKRKHLLHHRLSYHKACHVIKLASSTARRGCHTGILASM